MTTSVRAESTANPPSDPEVPTRWPRAVRVLLDPQRVFAETLERGSGYGALYAMLLLEFVLTRPLSIASQAMRFSFSPGAALSGLLTHYVNYALPTGIAVFVLGFMLYFALRGGERRVEPWTAASVLAFAWAPHVLLVALSVVVSGLSGLDHAIMPHHRFVGSSIGPAGFAAKVLLELTPSLILGVIAVRTALGVGKETSAAAPGQRRMPMAAVAAIVLVGGLGVAGHRVWSDWRAVRPIMPGDNLPAFALAGLDNPGMHHGQLHHQVALLDFWATWCPPCVAAMPHMEQLQRDFGDQGFQVVSINGGDESPHTVREFVREHELSFPIFVDQGELRRRFHVESFPTVVLVDRHGTVRHVYIGDTSAGRIRDDVASLLAEPDHH